MFDFDKWNEIFQTIRQHKLRTALTAFGVFWGIFMLVLLLGFGKGLYNGVMQDFDVAANSVFVWSQRTSEPYMGLKVGRFVQLTSDDADALRKGIPEAAVVCPNMWLGGNFTVNRGTKSFAFPVWSTYPELMDVEITKIQEGRFMNQTDVKEKRKNVVIGTEVQKILFKEGENPIGQFIKIKGVYFQIVGIFKGKGSGEQAVEDARKIYMPLPTAQQTFNMGNRIGWLSLLPKAGVKAEIVESKAKTILAKRHKVAPTDARAFGSANVEKEFEKIQGLFLGIALFSWVVSIGTIIAGVIGVGNIMLIIVRERTKEIGIRKALGATPFSVISMILQESIFLTSISGYAGLLAGTGVIELINIALKGNTDGGFFANPEVNPTVAFTALTVLIVAGALAGMIPASKAAAVRPVEALAYE